MLPKEIEPRRAERSLSTPEIPKDLITELETADEVQLPAPVTDDGGAPLVSPAVPTQIAITLPLTSQEMTAGLKAKVTTSWRWLAEWAKRVLKKTTGRFIYELRR